MKTQHFFFFESIIRYRNCEMQNGWARFDWRRVARDKNDKFWPFRNQKKRIIKSKAQTKHTHTDSHLSHSPAISHQIEIICHIMSSLLYNLWLTCVRYHLFKIESEKKIMRWFVEIIRCSSQSLLPISFSVLPFDENFFNQNKKVNRSNHASRHTTSKGVVVHSHGYHVNGVHNFSHVQWRCRNKNSN